MRERTEEQKKRNYEMTNIWKKNHPDRMKEIRKIYQDKHKESITEYQKEYRETYSEKIKEKKRIYRLANKEKIRIATKKWNVANPEKRQINKRKYRASKRGNVHAPYTDISIFERDSWMCGICGTKINKRLKWPTPRSKSIDHIIPISKGGVDAPVNLQASHLRCNISKSNNSGGQLRLIG